MQQKNIKNLFEQGESDDKILSSLNALKGKSKFEQLAELTNSTVRMEMIQLGLNPFNTDDISYYYKLQGEPSNPKFFQRVKAAFTLIFRNKVNEDLEIMALKQINAKIKVTGHGLGLRNPEVSTYNPATSDFIKQVVTAAPTTSYNDETAEEYKRKLKESLKSRMESTPEIPKESFIPVNTEIPIVDPISGAINMKNTTGMPSGKIKVKIPIETDEEVVKRITKAPTKRVRFKQEEGTKLPVSRGSGKRITPIEKDSGRTPSKPRRKR